MSRMFGLFALTLPGCVQPEFRGVVRDGAGSPLPGVRVQIDGCAAETGSDGRFVVPCPAGVYRISFEKDGYLPAVLESQALEAGAVELSPPALTEIPEERGLYRIAGGQALPLVPGRVVRVMGGRGVDAFKHYCAPPEEAPGQTARADDFVLLDHDADPWRAFVLDAEGCAYKISPSAPDRWDVDYSVNPEQREQAVGANLSVVQLQAPPGRVFVADWPKGFFSRLESAGEEREGYRGALFEVSAP